MLFMCYRQQRVVVNGVKSDWAPVVSGVRHGTVLGLLLFTLNINEITADELWTVRTLANSDHGQFGLIRTSAVANSDLGQFGPDP